jgi:hypothetical protein
MEPGDRSSNTAWILRKQPCEDQTARTDSTGARAGASEENWGTLSLVSGETRKVPTERGDYRAFYANVRDVIEKGAPLDVTPQQFLGTMRAIILAHKSSRERRVVQWNEPAE